MCVCNVPFEFAIWNKNWNQQYNTRAQKNNQLKQNLTLPNTRAQKNHENQLKQNLTLPRQTCIFYSYFSTKMERIFIERDIDETTCLIRTRPKKNIRIYLSDAHWKCTWHFKNSNFILNLKKKY